MKKMKLHYRNAIRVGLFSAVAILVCTGNVFAESVKFRIAGSNWEPRTLEWQFFAPCHSPLTVTVNATRSSENFVTYDVPIDVHIRKPGVSLNDPPSAIHLYTAKSTSSPVIFNTDGNGMGCSKPWIVRLWPKAFRTGNNTEINGTINFYHPRRPVSLAVEDAIFLGKGRSLTKNIGGTGGFSQGWVEVTGRWNHSVFGVTGPLPVKLNFELLKPDGSIAAYDTGYSSHEINPCCSGDKIKVRFLVREHATGQWKIRIRNDTGDDVMSIDPSATYTPACP